MLITRNREVINELTIRALNFYHNYSPRQYIPVGPVVFPLSEVIANASEAGVKSAIAFRAREMGERWIAFAVKAGPDWTGRKICAVETGSAL